MLTYSGLNKEVLEHFRKNSLSSHELKEIGNNNSDQVEGVDILALKGCITLNETIKELVMQVALSNHEQYFLKICSHIKYQKGENV